MQWTGLAPIVQLICKSRRVPPPGFELRAGAATRYPTWKPNFVMLVPATIYNIGNKSYITSATLQIPVHCSVQHSSTFEWSQWSSFYTTAQTEQNVRWTDDKLLLVQKLHSTLQ
jgi:hypothetical protein